jgi:hypothetical protein
MCAKKKCLLWLSKQHRLQQQNYCAEAIVTLTLTPTLHPLPPFSDIFCTILMRKLILILSHCILYIIDS